MKYSSDTLYLNYTMKELRKIARKLGIPYLSKYRRKNQIIDVIEKWKQDMNYF